MQKDLNLHVTIGEPHLGALTSGPEVRSSAPGAKQARTPQTRTAPRADAATEQRPRHSRTSRVVQAAKPKRSSRNGASTNGGARSIKITNLPWDTTTEQLRGLFAQFGVVHEATVITNRHTGRSKGFGFVDMTAEEATSAVSNLHGSKLDGRDLNVRFTAPKKVRA